MATEKITKRAVDVAIERAKDSKKNVLLWDEELKGFGCSISSKGTASYVIQYRMGGRGTRTQRTTLGRHGVFTPDEARKQAKIKLGEVVNGRDVAQEKKDARRKLAAGTFKEVTERYLAMNGKHNKSWPETRRILEHDAFPALGNKPMVTITRANVKALIDDTEQRSPSVARALFAALRPLFRWSVEHCIIDNNPISELKGPAPLQSRKRVLTKEEIVVFWKATEKLDWPFGPLYRLLLLTGQRRDEVASMTWSEIDLDKAMWQIPAERAKNKQEHEVTLSSQALTLLLALPGDQKGFVFTTTGNTPVSGFSKIKTRLDNLMKETSEREPKPWRTHDLRRTVATHMGEELAIDPGVIERILNHISGSQGGLQGIYQRQQYRQKRKDAVLAWGNFIDNLVTDRPIDNVVSLSAHR